MTLLSKIKYTYRWLFKPHFIAGERAEDLFEELCKANGWIVERIPQDKHNFDKYRNDAQDRVKRGDFIVRNLRNAEVEVKCYTGRNRFSKMCYSIAYWQIKGHETMQNKITGEPIIFAIFERNGRNVVEDSLRMIPLDELHPPYQRNKAVFYDENIKSLCFPLEIMYRGFAYFEKYKLKAYQNRY